MIRIVRSNNQEDVEALLTLYVPIFNKKSKAPFPMDFPCSRTTELFEESRTVNAFTAYDETDHVVGGQIVAEVSRETPPRYIPPEIFTELVKYAGTTCRLFYHTAIFKAKDDFEIKILLKEARMEPGCHFYATIPSINRKISAQNVHFLGSEHVLDEDRLYYCFIVDDNK